MKKLIAVLTISLCLSCGGSDDEEPTRIVTLYEKGENKNNVYKIQKPSLNSAFSHCKSIRESKVNGEVVSSENKQGEPLVVVSPDDTSEIKTLVNSLKMYENQNKTVSYEVRIWDENIEIIKEGYIDENEEGTSNFINKIKSVCQTNWPLPS